jgi:hypothetical protein
MDSISVKTILVILLDVVSVTTTTTTTTITTIRGQNIIFPVSATTTYLIFYWSIINLISSGIAKIGYNLATFYFLKIHIFL